MANNKSASKPKRAPSTASGGDTKVTRITASDSGKKDQKTTAKTAKSSTKSVKSTTASPKPTKSAKKAARADHKNVFARALGYFTGAWYELRQVHWPDRKNSWALTIGLIVFTLIFVAIILLLDALFQYLFGLVLGQ